MHIFNAQHIDLKLAGVQGREAYLQKRPPNFSKFKRLP